MEETMNNNNSNVVSLGSPEQVVTNTLPQPMNMNINMSVGNTDTTTGTTTMVHDVTTTTTTPPPPGFSGGGSLDLFGKKKRGRPRKYDSEGNLNLSYKKTTTPTSPQGFTLSSNDFSSKRGRGKSTGFGNYQIISSFGEYWYKRLCFFTKFTYPTFLFFYFLLWNLKVLNLSPKCLMGNV